ncbi:TIGR02452 family protein [Actinokineospora bangkokensis]|uniref:TIGR02452 family protein n=1 Tax=Actinokineospora bangkokensis TaxID=1193682 RepID=A0A1Q9LPJ1_9PSEU|nr:TIGR02452 family protein [Actinokineospora bangkokensis]OLR93921.1 TIGR02452 family protein [Actinokineospora bangkokensis]
MKDRLRAIAQETVAIADRGHYDTAAGTVSLAGAVAAAVSGTRLHLPDEHLPLPEPRTGPPTTEVTAETTLAAGKRLGGRTACLNFASARKPGGGFLNGAQAQEESLARASALYPTLLAAEDFYAHHRANHDLVYTDRVIYSPDVPVYRDDDGALLAQPYPLSFLTAAAPNRSAILTNQPERAAAIEGALRARATRVLHVAATHGHTRLVLGAWGCGVFGNDPALVADVFAAALRDNPYFEHVAFAVYDSRPDSPTRAAFARVFA